MDFPIEPLPTELGGLCTFVTYGCLGFPGLL